MLSAYRIIYTVLPTAYSDTMGPYLSRNRASLQLDKVRFLLSRLVMRKRFTLC